MQSNDRALRSLTASAECHNIRHGSPVKAETVQYTPGQSSVSEGSLTYSRAAQRATGLPTESQGSQI